METAEVLGTGGKLYQFNDGKGFWYQRHDGAIYGVGWDRAWATEPRGLPLGGRSGRSFIAVIGNNKEEIMDYNSKIDAARALARDFNDKGRTVPSGGDLMSYVTAGCKTVADVDAYLKAPTPAPQPAPVEEAPVDVQVTGAEPGIIKDNPNDPMAVIAQGVLPYLLAALPKPKTQVDRKQVVAIAEEAYKRLGSKILSLKVKQPNGKTITYTGVHRLFPDVLYLVDIGKHVYLHGRPGGGKTTLAKQAAGAKGVPHGYMMLNAMTTPSQVLGFIGADAKTYWPSIFRQMYGQAAIMVFDELDNCNANTLTTLNGPLENGECHFPDGILSMDTDFTVIATGNTSGRGGSYLHSDRRALDAATLARFVCVPFEYDLDLEEALVSSVAPTNHGDVLDWGRKARKWVDDNNIQLVVSPRELINIGRMTEDAPFDNDAVVEYGLIKGQLSKDTVTNLLKNCPIPNWKRSKQTVKSQYPKSGLAEAMNKAMEEAAEDMESEEVEA